jgi:hypothetical protein
MITDIIATVLHIYISKELKAKGFKYGWKLDLNRKIGIVKHVKI